MRLLTGVNQRVPRGHVQLAQMRNLKFRPTGDAPQPSPSSPLFATAQGCLLVYVHAAAGEKMSAASPLASDELGEVISISSDDDEEEEKERVTTSPSGSSGAASSGAAATSWFQPSALYGFDQLVLPKAIMAAYSREMCGSAGNEYPECLFSGASHLHQRCSGCQRPRPFGPYASPHHPFVNHVLEFPAGFGPAANPEGTTRSFPSLLHVGGADGPVTNASVDGTEPGASSIFRVECPDGGTHLVRVWEGLSSVVMSSMTHGRMENAFFSPLASIAREGWTGWEEGGGSGCPHLPLGARAPLTFIMVNSKRGAGENEGTDVEVHRPGYAEVWPRLVRRWKGGYNSGDETAAAATAAASAASSSTSSTSASAYFPSKAASAGVVGGGGGNGGRGGGPVGGRKPLLFQYG